MPRERLSQKDRPHTLAGDGDKRPPQCHDDFASSKPNSSDAGGNSLRKTLYLKSLIVVCLATVVLGLFPRLENNSAHTTARHKYSSAAIDGIKIGQTQRHARQLHTLDLDKVFDGTFSPIQRWCSWASEADDGVLLILDRGVIKAVNVNTNSSTALVRLRDIRDEFGQDFDFYDMRLSSDMKYLLVQADYRKRWRKSSLGNYYIHSLGDNTTWPLVPPNHIDPQTSYAMWSPTGQSIAFVKSNDVYILPSPGAGITPIRLTTTGSTALFNGIPDWAYEEGIFSSGHALWWSPTSSKLAYLSFNETNVPVYTFPMYNPTEDPTASLPYPKQVTIHYPKPGFENPRVQAWVWDAATGVNQELDLVLVGGEGSGVVQEVAWVGEEVLLVKVVNRNADDGRVMLYDLAEGSQKEGQVVRRLGKGGEEDDEGWIKSSQDVYRLPSDWSIDGSRWAYLDIVPNEDGWNHIALFDPANASEPVWLTGGEWEVTNGINGVDVKRGLVFFTAASPSSTDRNIYSVSLPTNQQSSGEIKALTDTTKPAHYSADFSPKGGWYLLDYLGPNVPWQKAVKSDETGFNFVVERNDVLKNVVKNYEAPTVLYSKIEIDGYEMNVKEIRPPNMDESGRTKYAVLFNVYGGPDSQWVHQRFERGWNEYLACTMRYVVVIVDGRGTGAKGRAMRNMVKGRLGWWEKKDQITAARIWVAKKYVDRRRIGIWGWSYGGFLSAKVIEANAGVHTLAMSIAPVTDWGLYSSIWTERFMNEPSLNPEGYANASISNVTGWHGVAYLLAHGSADDNVHLGNSVRLLSMFAAKDVKAVRYMMFPDSDHSMSRWGGTTEVYECMTNFIEENWGKDGRSQKQTFKIRRDFVGFDTLMIRFVPTLVTWTPIILPRWIALNSTFRIL
ncbi:dipeptidyl aminopeptidase [Desarmillaria ectypa]|nr:dipeptidyl aminopeptidase [Desarmillaria ectypa]